jgi:hypothetical protein
MGATNILPLKIAWHGTRIAIAQSVHADGVDFEETWLGTCAVGRRAGEATVAAHFRSEDAVLCAPDHAADGSLVLRGHIAQASYLGGFYRYAIRVGGDQYLVDNEAALSVGGPVGIALPAPALHLYEQAG